MLCCCIFSEYVFTLTRILDQGKVARNVTKIKYKSNYNYEIVIKAARWYLFTFINWQTICWKCGPS